MQGTKTASKFSPRLTAAIFVAIFFGAALYLRVILPYKNVFAGEWIKFTATDTWWHMRIVDNLVHNFPHVNTVDPYLLYPGPMSLDLYRFFDYFLAVIAWVVGLGSPTQHTIDMVGVYMPAILGAMVVIPVYFIGKAIINRWVGVIAAGLIAFSPGEFLGRSILGQTDHHVFEVLCTTTAMLFVIQAVRAARQQQLSFAHLRHWGQAVIIKPLIYSVLAGIMLGIYLNLWLGALLFVFIFFVYLVIQFVIDYFKKVNSDYLCFVGAVAFLVTLLIMLLLPHDFTQVVALLIAFIATLVLGIASRSMLRRGIRATYYLLVLLGAAVVGMALLYVITPSIFNVMISSFSVLIPTGARQTIEESSPILFPEGEFSFTVAWLNFSTGSILALVSLGMFIYFVIKRGEADKTMLVIWSLIILLITLIMRRFAYYYAVNVALLTAYLAWVMLQYLGFRQKVAQPVAETINVVKKSRQKKLPKKHTSKSSGFFIKASGIVIVFFLVLFPNIVLASEWAAYRQFAPSNAWCESLDWLRKNTPEPFGSPDFYYSLYPKDYKSPAVTPFSFYNGFNLIAVWDKDKKLAGAAANVPPAKANLAGAIFYDKFIASAGGTGTQIKIRCSAPGNVKVSVYSDDSGRPGQKLSAIDSGKVVAVGWNIIDIPPIAIVSGSSYWLGAISDKPCISRAAGGIEYYKKTEFSAFTAPDNASPDTPYGVAAHWDYGYWITRLGHRPPLSNPGIFQNRPMLSIYFLSPDEHSAISNQAANLSRYTIVDYDIAMPLQKYYSFLEYASVGVKQAERYDVYIQRSGGTLNRILLYYPEYYRSLVVRLYNFNGSQVVNHKPVVISYDAKETSDGLKYKEITSQRSFTNYDEAAAYIDSMQKQKPGNYRIVSADPFVSPVPMNALTNYKLVYSSNDSVMVPNVGRVPEVKIFEYLLR